ncbi:MAG TPA: acyl carrier protein [Thermoanaerobaculia bacterium]|jgi:acyl carrier protein|nr:acyl carrier protein [Thermoanaerobaculia bacterium]
MKRLQEVLAGVLMCDVESLPPSTPLSDVEGWDSLKHVMLVVGLETNFGVSLSADEIKSMVTLTDIGRILKEKGVDG